MKDKSISDEATRRDVLKAVGAGATAVAAGPGAARGEMNKPAPPQTAIPTWRGFNLLNFFQAFDRGRRSAGAVREDDCRWMRDWGFNFARIPMDYWLWIDSDWRKTRKLTPDDMFKIRQSALDKVDRTVELGRKYALHVSLNFHRAPGYCVNDPKREPIILWTDKRAQDAFVHHWEVFASDGTERRACLLILARAMFSSSLSFPPCLASGLARRSSFERDAAGKPVR